MKVELDDNGVRTMSAKDVVDRLVERGAVTDYDEEVVAFRLECGCDLEIDVVDKLSGDKYTQTVTERDVADCLCEYETVKWAKGESGEDVLLAFYA